MEQEFIDFVAQIFEMESSKLSLDTQYESVDVWDSLMQLRLVAEIGDFYHVDIPIDEVPNLKKLGDFYRYLQK